MTARARLFTGILLAFLFASIGLRALPAAAQSPHDPPGGWPEYGGSLGGQRYSSEQQISGANVEQLQVAWTFRTHALDGVAPLFRRNSSFEATPVLWNGTLYFDTPFGEVFALDASTGKERWRFDPKVELKDTYMLTSRGVALWHARRPRRGLCGDTTVLVATLDQRLIARDAATGQACPGFGNGGTVDLTMSANAGTPSLYYYTSPPIVVNDTIVLGSSVSDDRQIFAALGTVRGFDAATGKQRWSWDPVRWTGNQHPKLSGSGNAWAPLAADAEHDLVFLPTGAASVDYYGGLRVGDNRDANSIVALRASTGQRVWAFQLVHHDVWDYDTASQPLLFTFRGQIPAVAVTNKTGMIYVFNRLTGEPLYPIVERPVTQTTVPGEVTWPTQPFSTLPSLQPLRYSARDLAGNAEDKTFCRSEISRLNYSGLFTPPSEKGSLIYPSAMGGPNWGSSAFDPSTGTMYTRVNSVPYRLQLVPKKVKSPTLAERILARWRAHVSASASHNEDPMAAAAYRPPDMGMNGVDGSFMKGAPYSIQLQVILGPSGVPCSPAPYGRLVATNLNSGKQLWSVAHGKMLAAIPGSIGVGGPIVTAGGLVFVASTNDPFLRAYDSKTGNELWRGKLPAAANATPMTYAANGRQYVVVAVGGRATLPEGMSDKVVAFALPADLLHPPHASVHRAPQMKH